MANTYSQVNIHCVFAVKGRENVITNNFRDELHQFISVRLNALDCYPLAVGGWKDHVHTFFELDINQKIPDVMREIKAVSSRWINDNRFVLGKFSWQEGYGAFSHSRSQRHDVIQYIMNHSIYHESGRTS